MLPCWDFPKQLPHIPSSWTGPGVRGKRVMTGSHEAPCHSGRDRARRCAGWITYNGMADRPVSTHTSNARQAGLQWSAVSEVHLVPDVPFRRTFGDIRRVAATGLRNGLDAVWSLPRPCPILTLHSRGSIL